MLCAATVEEYVPDFLIGSDQGWVTAEYAMLPKSTQRRTPRTRNRGGRALEIQRLIGRSLRAVVDLASLGEHTIILDCDVIQADGGTRTTAVTGAMIALYDAVAWMIERGRLAESPIQEFVAATSVGIVDGESLLDLSYVEDSAAEVDFNVVVADSGRFVEVQGTAEQTPFERDHLDSLIDLGVNGASELHDIQKAALGL